MEILRLISSGSKSMVEVPSSTRPRRSIMPVSNRIASESDVLPAPPCATMPRLRILLVSNCPIELPPCVLYGFHCLSNSDFSLIRVIKTGMPINNFVHRVYVSLQESSFHRLHRLSSIPERS